MWRDLLEYMNEQELALGREHWPIRVAKGKVLEPGPTCLVDPSTPSYQIIPNLDGGRGPPQPGPSPPPSSPSQKASIIPQTYSKMAQASPDVLACLRVYRGAASSSAVRKR